MFGDNYGTCSYGCDVRQQSRMARTAPQKVGRLLYHSEYNSTKLHLGQRCARTVNTSETEMAGVMLETSFSSSLMNLGRASTGSTMLIFSEHFGQSL
jgi:hypothetical protein